MGELFWLAFLLLALQPLLTQRWRDYVRFRLIQRIEQQRGSRVILLVHRQETMSLLGIPIVRYMDINDSEDVLRAIRETDPKRPIDFVLHTPGGVAVAALQVARALKAWPGRVTVHVPHYAMSGGTLIALAADEICMTEHAVLGPVDPQVEGYPAASVLSVLERKPVADVEDATLILADVATKAVAQMRSSIEDLLAGRFEPERADWIARLLTEGTWTHDRPLTAADLAGMGFPVITDMPSQLLDLMGHYRPPQRGRRNVEYLPRE
ncbi:MAG: ATP-dependent Clp protease proteolytic subunit [Gammaproteobacteria bacterium]|jgi:ClpP class serine protease